MTQPIAVVVGAGAGLGAAIAQRFAAEGFAVAACARSADKLQALVSEINASLESQKSKHIGAEAAPAASAAASRPRGFVRAFSMDSSREDSVQAAFDAIRAQLGSNIHVLVYNAAQRKFRTENVLQVSPATVEAFWRVNCLGALLCVRQALPCMLADAAPSTALSATPPPATDGAAASVAAALAEHDPLDFTGLHKGTILFTGASASLRCLAGLTSMSIGKFGLRALAQGLAREFAPRGIHVAHVIVDGAVDSPLLRSYVKGQMAKASSKPPQQQLPPLPEGTPFEARFLQPHAVAHEYWNLHCQHPSTWTQELDLRPHVEPIMSRM